ncbi:MAG: lipopolysaccharide biosynthesis protein, partial [Erysipelotrichaceae bacterium]
MLTKLKQFTKKDNLAISTLIYFIGTMLLRSVSLISMPFFTRYMSQADYGLYSLYSTTLGLLAIFISLQVQSTVTLKFAHFEKERFEHYLSNVTLVPTFLFVGCLVLSGLFQIRAQGLGLPNVFVTLTIIVQAFYLTLQSIYLSNLIIKKQPKKHLVVSLLTTGMMVGLSILFTILLKSNGFYGRVLGGTLASLLMSI